MDAREYLNRKGVTLEHEPDKPNTLEEKAWERARDSGHARPKTGTPHDWEDWERYHDDLAEDAEALEQKIDKQAHRKKEEGSTNKESEAPGPRQAAAAMSGAAARKDDAVGQYVPLGAAAPKETASHPEASAPPAVGLALRSLAVLLPPLAVGLSGGGQQRILINVLLFVLGWIPGIFHAWRWLNQVNR